LFAGDCSRSSSFWLPSMVPTAGMYWATGYPAS
jgi:hypothetical protein